MQPVLQRTPIICWLLIGLLSVNISKAQFRGGADDGVSSTTAANQLLGQNIFRGGADDGHSFAFAANLNMGQNIFSGGVDDGFAMSFSPFLSMGQNIFTGGVDDGTTFAFSSNQPMGQNIFSGGVNDGVTLAASSNQPLGQNIFTGGSNDGWAFAMGTNLVLVPVTLKSFVAQWHNDEDVRTRWVTTMEANTDHFEVERSIDGSDFESTGNTPAAGNSTTERTYNYIDVNVNSHYASRPSHFYYRLKTVDIDGEVSYSAIVVLPNKGTSNAEMFVVYPNPAQQYIIVEFKNGAAMRPHILQLVANDGKILLQTQLIQNKETLQVGQYPSGTYYLKLTEKGSRTSQSIKFIIQH